MVERLSPEAIIRASIQATVQKNKQRMVIGETPNAYLYKKHVGRVEVRDKQVCLTESARRQDWWQQGVSTLLSDYYQNQSLSVVAAALVGSTAYGVCLPKSDIDVAVVVDDLCLSPVARYHLIKQLTANQNALANGFNDLCRRSALLPPAHLDLRPVIASSYLQSQ